MAMSAVIVGGGFAGLSAGYYLRKAGWNVTLLEAADDVGGRVRTLRKQGYTIDLGATQMSSGYRQYLDLCAELGMRDQMIESSPYVGLLSKGKVHVIDSRSMLSSALTPALSLRSKFTLLKAARDAAAIQPPIDVFDVSRSSSIDVESASDYARRRLNQELLDVLVDPLVRTYVMNRAEYISALEWFSGLKNLGGQTMLTLCGGNDRLPRAMAQHLDVRTHSTVKSVSKAGTGIEVRYTDAKGGTQLLRADRCVLATRLHEALAIYPDAARIAGGLGNKLRYHRAWVAHLGYRRPPNSKVVGVMIPTVEQPDISLLWHEHNKNPDRVPAGHALFSVYSDEGANDINYGRSDAELVQLASTFVETLYPELAGQQDLANITRWPCAIPSTAPGIYKEIAAMQSRMDAADSVQMAGDFLTCTGQNSAIFYGKRAAENLLKQANNTLAKEQAA